MSQTTTPPNAPEVDAISRMRTQAAQFRVDSGNFTQDELIAQTKQDRTAVAELIAREAALVAERDALAADVGALRSAAVALLERIDFEALEDALDSQYFQLSKIARAEVGHG